VASLDGDRDRGVGAVAVRGEGVEQQRPASGVVTDTSLQEHGPGVVDEGDVVVVVGPVNPAEQCHRCSPSLGSGSVVELWQGTPAL
jgi:hypothetical protein